MRTEESSPDASSSAVFAGSEPIGVSTIDSVSSVSVAEALLVLSLLLLFIVFF